MLNITFHGYLHHCLNGAYDDPKPLNYLFPMHTHYPCWGNGKAQLDTTRSDMFVIGNLYQSEQLQLLGAEPISEEAQTTLVKMHLPKSVQEQIQHQKEYDTEKALQINQQLQENKAKQTAIVQMFEQEREKDLQTLKEQLATQIKEEKEAYLAQEKRSDKVFIGTGIALLGLIGLGLPLIQNQNMNNHWDIYKWLNKSPYAWCPALNVRNENRFLDICTITTPAQKLNADYARSYQLFFKPHEGTDLELSEQINQAKQQLQAFYELKKDKQKRKPFYNKDLQNKADSIYQIMDTNNQLTLSQAINLLKELVQLTQQDSAVAQVPSSVPIIATLSNGTHINAQGMLVGANGEILGEAPDDLLNQIANMGEQNNKPNIAQMAKQQVAKRVAQRQSQNYNAVMHPNKSAPQAPLANKGLALPKQAPQHKTIEQLARQPVHALLQQQAPVRQQVIEEYYITPADTDSKPAKEATQPALVKKSFAKAPPEPVQKAFKPSTKAQKATVVDNESAEDELLSAVQEQEGEKEEPKKKRRVGLY